MTQSICEKCEKCGSNQAPQSGGTPPDSPISKPLIYVSALTGVAKFRTMRVTVM